jgi:hypothetical protein
LNESRRLMTHSHDMQTVAWETVKALKDMLAASKAFTPFRCAFYCVALFLLVSASGCTEGGSQPSKAASETSAEPATFPQAAEDPAIFALLADNSLVKVSPVNGRVKSRISLRPSSPVVGRYLAPSKDGKTLFALVARGRDGTSEVAVIDVTTTRVRDRYALPKWIAFRSLVAGPETGHLYLFGNRPGKKITCPDLETCREQDVVVVVLDPDSGRVLRNRTVREADGKAWTVYRSAVSPDESRLFVSYHGDTQGVDWITITPESLKRCQKQGAYQNQGCIPAHSGVEAYGDRILVTPGDSPWIEERTREGELVRKWDTKQEGNHMLDLALDAREGRLYALGSCGYRGGLSRIDLKTNEVKVLAPSLPGVDFARERLVCGERVVVGPGSLLVVGKTAQAIPQAGIPGSLLLVEGDTGRKIRTLNTPCEPVDVLVVSRL